MFNKHPKKLLLPLIVILLVPKVDASQASSTSSASSSSAQPQMSFTQLMASLLASSQESVASNSDHRDPARAQTSQLSPLQKIEETIKRGELLRRKGNLALATTFMKHAYDHSTKFPAQHAHTAGRLGMILCDQGQQAQALPYLEEAYTFDKDSPLNNISQTALAYNLGRIYLYDKGVKPNYSKAFAFLNEAQKCICSTISIPAKNLIGLIYLNGLGKQQDLLKARAYFGDSLNGAQKAQAAIDAEIALNNLLDTLILQTIQFDSLCASIEQQQTSSRKRARSMLKQAHAELEEIKTTKKMLPFELTTILDGVIEDCEKQFAQLQAQMNQESQQQSHDQSPAQKAGENAQKCSKTAVAQPAPATIQSRLKKAVEHYEAFLKKPTDARYQEAAYALREMLPLTLNDAKTRAETLQMLDRISETAKQQKKIEQSITATSDTQEKKEASKTGWSLFDPFHQIIKPSAPVQQRLNLLQIDYLEVPDVLKLHGFINLWRTRVGNIRILYTVLPKAHAIGIVQIDDRKDVYENVAELKHREAWFYEPNLDTRLQERAQQKS